MTCSRFASRPVSRRWTARTTSPLCPQCPTCPPPKQRSPKHQSSYASILTYTSQVPETRTRRRDRKQPPWLTKAARKHLSQQPLTTYSDEENSQDGDLDNEDEDSEPFSSEDDQDQDTDQEDRIAQFLTQRITNSSSLNVFQR